MGVRVGTAGWSLPAKPDAPGTHLSHYARALSCAEINSSFYRPHRAATWARWAAETPPGFRFSIKAPRLITHEAKLRDAGPLLHAFFEQIEPMRSKAGPILFQLPPSLAFEASVASDFLAAMRARYSGEAAIEPRHASWFTPQADSLLQRHAVARVAADPPKGAPEAAQPGGDTALVYYRLHGSPHTYFSCYDDAWLQALAVSLSPRPNAWVVFDNTAHRHAFANALRLQELLSAPWSESPSGARIPA